MKKLGFTICVVLAMLKAAAHYEVGNVPGDLEPGSEIRVVAGENMPLNFILRTTPENLKKTVHKAVFEWTVPSGGAFIGVRVLHEKHNLVQVKKNHWRDSFDFPGAFVQALRESSEWKVYKCVIAFPEKLSPDARLGLKVYIDGVKVCERLWPLQNSGKIFPADLPVGERLRFGIWDYGYYLLNNGRSETLEFWKKVGFNYCQARIFGTIAGFLSGGNLHHSVFINPVYPNFNASGKNLGNSLNLGDPRAIIELGVAKVLPEAERRMAETAAEYNGIVCIDYEPTGQGGFTPRMETEFLRKYAVTSAEFAEFRKAMAKWKFASGLHLSGRMGEIYRQWHDFGSMQSSLMVKMFRDSLKRNKPEARLEITTHDSVGEKDQASFLIGNDNSRMAVYLDAIMPQIYRGYGAAEAKEATLRVRQWRGRITQLNRNCRLYPLLLVRHMGATMRNSPRLLRLQCVGAVAEGADGFILYYAQQIDGAYWLELNRTITELLTYERFYLDGRRSGENWIPDGLPEGTARIRNWPEAHVVKVKNPLWHYTAHTLADSTLLTLFNYSDEALTFRFGKNLKFTVPAQEVMFEVVNEQCP